MGHVNSTRFQFVWWGWWVWHLHWFRDEGSLRSIYDWRAMIGPLEIRKWHRGPTPEGP